MRQLANIKTVFNVELYKTIVNIYQDLFWAVPARFYESFKDEVVEAQTMLEKLNPEINQALAFTHEPSPSPEDIQAHVAAMDQMTDELETLKDFLIRNVSFTATVPSRDELTVNDLNSGQLCVLRDRLMEVFDMIRQVAATIDVPINLEEFPMEEVPEESSTYAEYFNRQIGEATAAIHDAAHIIQFGSDEQHLAMSELTGLVDKIQIQLTRALQLASVGNNFEMSSHAAE